MYYPTVEENGNSRTSVDTWLGYNHNYRVSLGEFYDMENLTSDGYPIMMPRSVRPLLLKATKQYRGILYTDDAIAYLDGYEFHYSQWSLDLTNLYTGAAIEVTADTAAHDDIDDPTSWEEQTLLRFGSYVLIYPDFIWVNLNTKTAGLMGSKYETAVDTTISYSMCTADGSSYDNLTVSDTEPASPSEGDYWLCSLAGSVGLNVYADSSWTPVATTYIRISIPGATLTNNFSVSDVVTLNSYKVTDINAGSQIKAMGDEYLVVLGILPNGSETETTSTGWKLTIERKMPKLDYVCTDKNRVWGCRYGDQDGEIVNEIYATKLGDFKNWYTYQSLSTDSYAVSVGVPGEWTGCISYGGYPVFFKENAIFRIYGSMPSEYQMVTTDARGVQNGSSKSLAIVNESLFYKAPGGVMVYDGSLPTLISTAFGRDTYYYDGVAGVAGNKYYIEMTNSYGGHVFFVYDSQYGLWMKESQIQALQFTGAVNGQLYVATKSEIYGLGSTDNSLFTNKLIGEEWVEWEAETGEIGFEYADFKYVSRVTIRAYVPYTSEIQVEISYDEGKYETVGTIRGNDEIMSQTLAIVPYRCDHFKLKFSGHGAVRIYTLSMTLDTGSEEYEYKN